MMPQETLHRKQAAMRARHTGPGRWAAAILDAVDSEPERDAVRCFRRVQATEAAAVRHKPAREAPERAQGAIRYGGTVRTLTVLTATLPRPQNGQERTIKA
jgi:hypothetical protein